MIGTAKHSGDFLTQEQVNALPVGTRVVITWTGGNGPWEYVVVSHSESGCTYVRSSRGPLPDPVDFVGSEIPFTLVTIAENDL